MQVLDETFNGDLSILSKNAGGAQAPWKDNWFTKVLERQMDQAAQDGLFRVAVPLDGSSTAGLVRSGRVAETYRTAHRKAMQKLAKRHGWTYSEYSDGFTHQAEVDTILKHLKDGKLTDAHVAARELQGQLTVGSPGDDAIEALLSLRPQDVGKDYYDHLVGVVTQAFNTAKADKTVYGVINFGQETSSAAPMQALREALESGDTAAIQAAGRAVQEAMPNEDLKSLASIYAEGKPALNPRLQNEILQRLDVESTALKPSKRGGFSLYSSPAAGALATYAMIRNLGEDETKANLASQGLDEGEIEDALADAELVEKFTAAGASEAQIKGWFEARQPKIEAEETQNTTELSEDNLYNTAKLPSIEEQIASEGSEAADKAAALRRKEQLLRAKEALGTEDTIPSNELFGMVRVVHPDQTFLVTRVSGWFGDEEDSRIADDNAARAVEQITKTMKAETGLDVTWNEEAGVWFDATSGQPLTEGMWDDIWQDLKGSKYEIGYGVAGGIAGARAGAARGGWIGGAVGSVLGAIGGSALGTNLDYLRESVRLGTEMKGDVAFRKALNSAELSVVGDAAGLALAKVFKASIGAGRRVIDFARGNDIPSATKALQAHMAVTEDEATELATQLARLSTVPGATQAEQNIAATIMTQPGGERIIKAATQLRPRAGQAMIRSVDDRAQALLKHTSELRDPQAARNILADLDNYRADVKQVFSDVKAEAAQSVNANNFSFNFDELAIEPILNGLKNEIVDPTARQRFLNQMKQIKQYSKTRKFSDLLELRQIVNNLTYSKRIRSAKDFKALQGVIRNIDDQIEAGAKVATDKPEEWLGHYREANRLYSEMKQLENNQLYKLLNRKGMTAEGIAKALTRYAPALDDTYLNVINKLPRQTRDAVEGEVFNILSTKYTTGVTGGLRATQFPMLADELKTVPFTSPGARKLRDATVRLGEVFKNDIPLAQSGGQLQIPRFQSYLTTDPVVRAKFELASGIFNRMKQMVPGEQQQDLALVNVLTKLLDQPLNAKLMDELIEEAGDRVDVEEPLRRMVEAATRATADNADAGAPRVKVYGEGKIVSLKGGPNQASTGSIPVHRIASTDTVAQLATAEGINVADRKAVDEMLKSQGYSAVQQGTNKIRRLD